MGSYFVEWTISVLNAISFTSETGSDLASKSPLKDPIRKRNQEKVLASCYQKFYTYLLCFLPWPLESVVSLQSYSNFFLLERELHVALADLKFTT